jgi:hypothetical protein
MSMSLTITVTDPLAHRLQFEADSRKIPVEQFALEILGQAVQGHEWPPANRRRLALIRKQFATGLTGEEVAELQELQRQADRHLEALDSAMLDDVAAMEKSAMEALDAGTP